MTETKYYMDAAGYYLGAFIGDTGLVPDGAIEVPSPPEFITQIWNGAEWV